VIRGPARSRDVAELRCLMQGLYSSPESFERGLTGRLLIGALKFRRILKLLFASIIDRAGHHAVIFIESTPRLVDQLVTAQAHKLFVD
jgi:hypothetical protein